MLYVATTAAGAILGLAVSECVKGIGTSLPCPSFSLHLRLCDCHLCSVFCTFCSPRPLSLSSTLITNLSKRSPLYRMPSAQRSPRLSISHRVTPRPCPPSLRPPSYEDRRIKEATASVAQRREKLARSATA